MQLSDHANDLAAACTTREASFKYEVGNRGTFQKYTMCINSCVSQFGKVGRVKTGQVKSRLSQLLPHGKQSIES